MGHTTTHTKETPDEILEEIVKKKSAKNTQMAPRAMTPEKRFTDECPIMESEEKSRKLLSKAIKVSTGMFNFLKKLNFFSIFEYFEFYTDFKQICERKIESQGESQQAKPVACRRGFSEPVAQPISNFNRRKNKKGLSLTI